MGQVRRAWIVAAISVALLCVLALVEWNVLHAGTFGVAFDPSQGDVLAVDPGKPAAAAGIVVGDRIDLRSVPSAAERRVLLDPRFGESVRFDDLHGGQSRTITLVAVEPRSSLRTVVSTFAFPILVLISVGLATLLLLLRPQPATWAFYAYALLMAIKSFEGNLTVASPSLYAVIQLFFELSWSAAVVALLLFATRIFAWSRPWRGYVEAAVGAIALVDAFAWTYPPVALLFGWYSDVPWMRVEVVLDAILLTIVLLALVAIGLSSKREGRQRTIWILAGISLVPLLEWLDALVYLVIFAKPEFVAAGPIADAFDIGLRPWLPIFAALAVYYALVRERIVDIRLALGRAAEYALTTAVVVIIFAVLEWGITEVFSNERAATYASLIAAVVVGFSFNAVHERVDTFIESIFFFKERDAEQRLRRIAQALLYANSERSVIEFLLDQPVEALELTSGAVFMCNGERTALARIAARGWESAALDSIDLDDALIAQLRATRQPLELTAAGWHPHGLPTGETAPTLAILITMRSDPYALALYGRHVGGAIISGDARALLQSIAASAAAAFDHLDAERTRREIDALKSENAILRGANAS